MTVRPPDLPEGQDIHRDLHLVPEWRWLAFAVALAVLIVALVAYERRHGWPEWAVPATGARVVDMVEPAER